MRYPIALIISFLLTALIILPATAETGEYKWGIGIQGNYPLWGGLSIKYLGFHPIDLLVIGRIYLNKSENDSSFVGAVSCSLLETKYSRTYIMIGGGGRSKRQDWQDWRYYPKRVIPPDEYTEPIVLKRSERSLTLGVGIMFGNEFILFSRYGFNLEFGQGIGRVHEKVEYPDPKASELTDLDRRDEAWFQSSFVFGFGFHVYF